MLALRLGVKKAMPHSTSPTGVRKVFSQGLRHPPNGSTSGSHSDMLAQVPHAVARNQGTRRTITTNVVRPAFESSVPQLTAARGPGMLRIIASKYNTIATKYPMLTGMGSATVMLTLADISSQKLVEKQEKMDWRRTAALGSFGLFYGGVINYKWYCLLDYLIPQARFGVAAAVVIKTALDNFVMSPLVYIPVYYLYTGLFKGMSLQEVKEKFMAEYVNTVKMTIQVWVPTKLVVFYAVPTHLRVGTVCCISFVWNTILSFVSYGSKDTAEERLGDKVDATGNSLRLCITAAEDTDSDTEELLPVRATVAPEAAAAEPTQVRGRKLIRQGPSHKAAPEVAA
eukprot:GFYU01002683.1.p1 GENE.GFYU01002683.1~~GFYU01002683.1.p1  ORF type:complete len:341 (-),score=112.30 GFYU01002683.1:145-1167(-)